MSTTRQHADWLSLVEQSGPFLSLPVLCRVFPQGLDRHDPAVFQQLKLAYEEWLDQVESRKPDPALHRAWVEYILTEVLSHSGDTLAEGQRLPPHLQVQVEEHGETLRPDWALLNSTTHTPPGRARLLVQMLPPNTHLEKPIPGRRWKASPATRMAELLRGSGVPLGLLTNGEQWMLVHAVPGDPTGLASWYADLWLQEPQTLQAFRSLLDQRRFFGVAEEDTLEALYLESAQDQQELTDQLGRQVRKAVEVLVAAIDRIDRDRKGALLSGVTEAELYEGALTVMMRLVFLFCAEERQLLPLNDELYNQNYALSTLSARLRETADQQGEEVLERRHDAWGRLLATFRVVFAGVEHDRMRMPAYGGGLFDPDRFPFLEGRPRGTSWRDLKADPLPPIHNRCVLHLLEALQVLQVRVPGGGAAEARRLSFRALEITQIGHVYEGLLDHSALRARGPVLGLAGSKNLEPEIALRDLEKAQDEGDEELLDLLREQTGRSASALRKALQYEAPGDDRRWLVACNSKKDLLKRVRPFAGLVRDDTTGYPVVIDTNSVYVTQTGSRRATGTHYTPRSLTESIVRYTLEPVVYEGPAEGRPRSEWRLRIPRELLNLRVCDPAMGSGAFLVQACEYLAERLVEAWEEVERQASGRLVVTPEGDLSTGAVAERPLPRDAAERLILARRYVADRCLYGVDKNPMAVEMAKLSLWLVTMQKDRPFSFLDHALRSGDSLLGLTEPEQVQLFNIRPEAGTKIPVISTVAVPAFAKAVKLRQRLERQPVEEIRHAEEKARLMHEAEGAVGVLRLVADLVVGAALVSRSADDLESRLGRLADRLVDALSPRASASARQDKQAELGREAQAMLQKGRPTDAAERRPLHWVLEYPEVFADANREARGFDAIVGNPPFQGGTIASTTLGTDYTALIKRENEPWHGKADLVGAFFRRSKQLLRGRAFVGFLATASLCRGETADSSLRPLLLAGAIIYRGRSPFQWPGAASVTAVCVWMVFGGWRGGIVLDSSSVDGIGVDLEEDSLHGSPVMRLGGAINAFLGVKLAPANQPLSAEDVDKLPMRLRSGLLPAVGGDELGSLEDPTLARPAFDVQLMSDGQIKECARLLGRAIDRGSLEHSAPARELRRLMTEVPLLIACNETTHRHLVFHVFRTHRLLLKHTAIGIPASRWGAFALLQSAFHEIWTWKLGIRRKEDLRYSPKRCSATFPLPAELRSPSSVTKSQLDLLGERYCARREEAMLARAVGATEFYNRFHDKWENSKDIRDLRDLHLEMDTDVGRAYGWGDLHLGHGFHATDRGVRFTIDPKTGPEILARLFQLNEQRHQEEIKKGLHEKSKTPMKGSTRRRSPTNLDLDLER